MNSLSLRKTLLRPSRIELVILVVLVMLSLIIVNNSEATSKATWEVSRGIPFTVVVFDECRGPCTPVGFLSLGTVISFSFVGLLLNILCATLAFFLVLFLAHRHHNFWIGS
jgi:hypothetical protein